VKQGLKILSKVRAAHGFGIITEAIDSEIARPRRGICRRHSDRRAQHAEFFFAQARRPRPKSPSSSSAVCPPRSTNFSMAAEYIMSEGNYNVIDFASAASALFRFFTQHARPRRGPRRQEAQPPAHLVDPSHGTGKRHKVLPLSRAAVAVGADGLLNRSPSRTGQSPFRRMQSILPEEFAVLADEMRQIAAVLHRTIN